ncbi:IS5 family transposase [Streptomyces sp. NRRL F-2799]|uniref:IS5 family transposase n=1 Tax=Streptomyces sp. NRRL F-2799 TaxID=1463844 RepID=UPI003B636E58
MRAVTDAQWARIEPLLPDRTPRRGGRWRDYREVIDAIAWKFQTGSQWIHLPEKYGDWRGIYNRPRMWAAADGTWERVFTALVAQADADDLNWSVSVDSTIVRAHQHAAGPAKRGSSRRTGRPCHRSVPGNGGWVGRREGRCCCRVRRGRGWWPTVCLPVWWWRRTR